MYEKLSICFDVLTYSTNLLLTRILLTSHTPRNYIRYIKNRPALYTFYTLWNRYAYIIRQTTVCRRRAYLSWRLAVS